MENITVTLKTITPLFLGGASPHEKAEFRAPSIKGALRFWYRASKGNLSLEKLRKNEENLFGGTDKEAGQSNVHIVTNRLVPITSISKNKFPSHLRQVKNKSFEINILDYLCYGTYDYQKGSGNVFNRPYIIPGTEITISFRWSMKLCQTDIIEIFKAFHLMHSFGGLGARSRNGFGSFEIINTQPEVSFGSSNITDLLPPFGESGLANYTALSKETRLYKTSSKPFDTWDQALATIGTAYKNSREKIERRHYYEKRQYIAAPIIVGKGANAQKSLLDRHSKPYFMHVHPVSVDGLTKYIGIILFLPYKYCENHPAVAQDSHHQDAYANATKELNQYLVSEGLEEVYSA